MPSQLDDVARLRELLTKARIGEGRPEVEEILKRMMEREVAGQCPHGHADSDHCPDCCH